MFTRIAGELAQVPENIRQRQIDLFFKVHPEYGQGIVDALNLVR